MFVVFATSHSLFTEQTAVIMTMNLLRVEYIVKKVHYKITYVLANMMWLFVVFVCRCGTCLILTKMAVWI